MPSPVISRLAIAAVAAAALSGPATGGSHAAAPERAPRLDEHGAGSWVDFGCIAPATGRCEFTLSGSISGRVVADGTYYVAIDDRGAATPTGCVDAHLAGLFGDRAPDQNIGFVGDGRLCPDGAGGYVFTSPFRVTGGGGRFARVKGSGTFSATLGPDHSSTVTLTGRVRGIR